MHKDEIVKLLENMFDSVSYENFGKPVTKNCRSLRMELKDSEDSVAIVTIRGEFVLKQSADIYNIETRQMPLNKIKLTGEPYDITDSCSSD